MFSSRLAGKVETNRLTQLLEKKRREPVDILDLTDSNPTLCGMEYPVSEILSAFSTSESVIYQPAPKGLDKARLAVADYYRERGHHVSIEDIFLTSSTSEAYSFLFKLLADPGDQVLVPRPGYPLFEFLARLEGIEAVSYPLLEADGWHIDLESLRRRLSQRTRAVLLVNPNNPTGSLVSHEQWEQLVALCQKGNLAMICDEVFFDYPVELENPAFDPTGENRILTFVLNGLSKTAALPQMKLAWILIRGPRDKRSAAGRGLEIISDTFLSVSAPVQHATPSLLALRRCLQPQVKNRVGSNLARIKTSLANSPAHCLSVQAGWYAVIRVPLILSEEEWVVQLLEHENLLLHPGYFYDFEQEAFLITSLLPREDRFQEGMDRLQRHLLSVTVT